MKILELKTEKRTTKGRKAVNKLREAGESRLYYMVINRTI